MALVQIPLWSPTPTAEPKTLLSASLVQSQVYYTSKKVKVYPNIRAHSQALMLHSQASTLHHHHTASVKDGIAMLGKVHMHSASSIRLHSKLVWLNRSFPTCMAGCNTNHLHRWNTNHFHSPLLFPSSNQCCDALVCLCSGYSWKALRLTNQFMRLQHLYHMVRWETVSRLSTTCQPPQRRMKDTRHDDTQQWNTKLWHN